MVNFPALVHDWHRHELREDYGFRDNVTRCVMGFPLYGTAFVTNFLDYMLPSLEANRKALQGCRLVMFIGERDLETDRALDVMGSSDVSFQTRLLPDAIMDGLRSNPVDKYPLLAACHNLLIAKAGEAGAGFHMTVGDTCYSNRYFEGLLRLSVTHDAIAHTGFAIVAKTGLPALDAFRRGKRLAVSAEDLGRLGWRHLNPQWKSWGLGDDLESLPDSHWVYSRGRESVRIHTSHQSAVWMSPERCRAAGTGIGGTVDSELPRYLGSGHYTPTLADEMVYCVIAHETQPTPRIGLEAFRRDFWRFIGDNRAFLPYFAHAVHVPVALDDDAPGDFELDLRMERLMEALEAK